MASGDKREQSTKQTLLAAAVPFAVVFVVLIAWLPSLMARLDPLTGDEPFYVMTALSLVNDHDLDESNNYEERDYASFYPALGPTQNGWQSYPDPLPPHPTNAQRPGLYSKHGLGLAMVIALPWKIGGRNLTLLVLAIFASLVAANMSLLGLRSGATLFVSTVTAGTLALTSPLLSFSLLIFPEIAAALCIIYAARRLLEEENRWWQWLLIGICTATLPWLHLRLLPVSLAFAAVTVIRFRSGNRKTDWVMVALMPLISALSLYIWADFLYRGLIPPASDHAGFSDLSGTLNGLAGTFLDQQWGALIHNSLLVLAIASCVPYARRHRKDAAILAAIALPYLILISAYSVWWGEWNPPARYLVDIVPLLAAPLAWWLSHVRPLIGSIALTVAAVPAVAVAGRFVADPQFMYNHPDGTSHLFQELARKTPLDFTGVVPSYVSFSLSPTSDRVLFALGGIALIVIISSCADRAVMSTRKR